MRNLTKNVLKSKRNYHSSNGVSETKCAIELNSIEILKYLK